MVLILSMLTALQTALDYAEPTQRALLVERIRPVRPLIRNTPYGKRIQNKLQREQMDHFGGGGGGGGYNNQQALVSMALGNQGMGLHHGAAGAGARHIPATIQNGPMAVYSPQNGLYSSGGHGMQSQGSFGPAHMAPHIAQLTTAIHRWLRPARQFQPQPGHVSFPFTWQRVFRSIWVQQR
jgi:hypothetical protein